ncbi:MAG TPA: 50S ribosomal protein L11 methyltransferase [Chitinophagaceae bacterium]|jgi:ribosomal protein L11 methyltransferase|nr:50S ribosomal protein L11 methyltransferase [Chitinophagaceae bacterium]
MSKQYIQITFQNLSADQSDLLLAALSEYGFDGFEEQENLLNAFIPAADFDESVLQEVATKHQVSYNTVIIEETNWNATWESSFQPVVVDDFVAIRADFHEPVQGVEQEIIITPKMSFGTGHHATTYMMIQQMRQIDFTDKTVFDFGTGTGVLSILAEKSGASSVVAVDNDEWSITNAAENLQRNDCSKVKLVKAGTITGDGRYDIILANINKNVILGNFSSLAGQLSPGGILLLSGLLEGDETDILMTASNFPLVFSVKETRNKWISLRFEG